MSADTQTASPSPTHRLLAKAMHYCALQERCTADVRRKLADWEATADEASQVLHTLVDEGYLNDERYARAYCESKLRHAHWSRRKVMSALRTKQIGAEAIEQGMQSVDDEEYYSILHAETAKKLRTLKGEPHEVRRRLIAFLAQRGYTMDEILRCVDATIPTNSEF